MCLLLACNYECIDIAAPPSHTPSTYPDTCRMRHIRIVDPMIRLVRCEGLREGVEDGLRRKAYCLECMMERVSSGAQEQFGLQKNEKSSRKAHFERPSDDETHTSSDIGTDTLLPPLL